MELDQAMSEKSCQFCSYKATAGSTSTKADSTDLSVVAKVYGGALPVGDRACLSQWWLKGYEAKL